MTTPVGAGARGKGIFLVGPMGAGKSTVGRCLAQLLGREFVDADHVLEERTGAKIPLIFEIEGEPGFRRRESAVLEELGARADIVLATGGGAVLAPSNRELLRRCGTTVYLYAPLEVLLERTAHDRNRPLLQTPDRRKTLEDILRIRDPLYREVADIIVETSRRPAMNVAREIAAKLKMPEGHEDTHA
jgi:shikimate kinase